MQASDRHYALMAPVGNRTWEARTLLPGLSQETGTIKIPFTQPVRITAFRPSLCVQIPIADLLAHTLFVPTLDDIQVFIDISERSRLTNRFDNTRIANSEGGQFVSLSTLCDDLRSARMVDLFIDQGSPTIGVNFAWKRSVTGGALYYDTEIGLAIDGEYPDERF